MLEFEAGQFAVEYQTTEGKRLWAVLNRDDVVARMETASDLGQPALAPIEDILLAELGTAITRDRYKQMAGKMVRQVMEAHGFEHEASDVRLNSVPFYKASRYRRRDQNGLYLFKNSSDPRLICLVATRKGEAMPAPEQGRWMYVNFLTSNLKAHVGYNFDLKAASHEVASHGYFLHRVPRMMRAG
jgi:hypothetical protein